MSLDVLLGIGQAAIMGTVNEPYRVEFAGRTLIYHPEQYQGRNFSRMMDKVKSSIQEQFYTINNFIKNENYSGESREYLLSFVRAGLQLQIDWFPLRENLFREAIEQLTTLKQKVTRAIGTEGSEPLCEPEDMDVISEDDDSSRVHEESFDIGNKGSDGEKGLRDDEVDDSDGSLFWKDDPNWDYTAVVRLVKLAEYRIQNQKQKDFVPRALRGLDYVLNERKLSEDDSTCYVSYLCPKKLDPILLCFQVIIMGLGGFPFKYTQNKETWTVTYHPRVERPRDNGWLQTLMTNGKEAVKRSWNQSSRRDLGYLRSSANALRAYTKGNHLELGRDHINNLFFSALSLIEKRYSEDEQTCKLLSNVRGELERRIDNRKDRGEWTDIEFDAGVAIVVLAKQRIERISFGSGDKLDRKKDIIKTALHALHLWFGPRERVLQDLKDWTEL